MKTLLSIGELNTNGDTGIQSDTKVAEYFYVSCKNALTAIVMENSSEIFIEKIDKQVLQKQLQCILDNSQIDSIKIGLMPSVSSLEVIKDTLTNVTVPVILDPIFIQHDKNFNLNDKIFQEIISLFPYTTIITPNIHEAKVLFGEKLDINAPCPVFVKNMPKKDGFVDRLFYANNQSVDFKSLSSEESYKRRLLFSTALSAQLAINSSIEESIGQCYKFLEEGYK